MSQSSNTPKTVGPRESLEDGWVERQVIRNHFQHLVRQLDEMFPSSARFPVKEAALELVETAKFKILQASKGSAEILKSATRQGLPQSEPAPDQREAHSARLAQMRGRAQ